MNLETEKFLPKLDSICPGHCRTYLRYHIIFVTKYRRKVLDKIRDDVFEAFRYCECKSNLTIHTMNLEADHIHLIVSFPVTYTIGQTVSRLKQMTTNWLYREKNDYLRQFYWKKKRLLWTHGYYVGTLGKVSEKTVFNYIKNQGK